MFDIKTPYLKHLFHQADARWPKYIVYKCHKGSSVHTCPSEIISTHQQWKESMATCTQTWNLSCRSNKCYGSSALIG